MKKQIDNLIFKNILITFQYLAFATNTKLSFCALHMHVKLKIILNPISFKEAHDKSKTY